MASSATSKSGGQISVRYKRKSPCDELRAHFRSIVAIAKQGRLSAGTYILSGKLAGEAMQKKPSLRILKGEQVVLKASHGIGHLINSIYQERAPPRPDPHAESGKR